MERNDVSFSLPTWNREEIRSLTMLQQQTLYANCPYNLNDFKNDNPNVEFIFKSEEQSTFHDFNYKREFNRVLEREIAVFVQFILEAIIRDSDTQKNKEVLVVSRLKQYLYKTDLCKFTMVPEQWQQYYKNQIIKKIVFQYLGKCVYNLSLVELLLITNSFLRFSIVLLIKNYLFEQKIINNFYQTVPFKKIVSCLADHFDFLFQKHPAQSPQKNSFFNTDAHSIRSLHYLLIQQQGQIFLYRKEINIAKIATNIPKPVQNEKKSDKTSQRTKKTTQNSKPQKNKQKGESTKKIANIKGRKIEVRERYFWDCLPCFSFRR